MPTSTKYYKRNTRSERDKNNISEAVENSVVIFVLKPTQSKQEEKIDANTANDTCNDSTDKVLILKI